MTDASVLNANDLDVPLFCTLFYFNHHHLRSNLRHQMNLRPYFVLCILKLD